MRRIFARGCLLLGLLIGGILVRPVRAQVPGGEIDPLDSYTAPGATAPVGGVFGGMSVVPPGFMPPQVASPFTAGMGFNNGVSTFIPPPGSIEIFRAPVTAYISAWTYLLESAPQIAERESAALKQAARDSLLYQDCSLFGGTDITVRNITIAAANVPPDNRVTISGVAVCTR